MNQNEIEAFLAIIKYGSISEAAKNLYISQPAISARIRSLESELGTELFSRSRGQRDTAVTPAGKDFETYANRWMKLWEDTKYGMGNRRQQKITISSNHSVNAYIMPDVYRRLSEESRKITFRFLSNHYNESYRLTESGEADFSLVSNLIYSRELKHCALFEDRMVVLVGEESDYQEQLYPGDLNKRSEVHLDWDENYGKWYSYWFGMPDIPSVETQDITFVRDFVQIGRNWAIVPLSVAYRMCRYGGMRYCSLTDPPLPRVTYLLYKNDLRSYPVIGDFIDCLHMAVGEVGGRWLMGTDI